MFSNELDNSKLNCDTQNYQWLENRLKILENKILGNANQLKLQDNLINNLIIVNNKLNNVYNKEKLETVNSQIKNYEKYINNVSLIDKCGEDSLVKSEIIMQNESKIINEKNFLEQITSKEKIIESKFINDFDTFIPKLKQLRQVALKQKEQVEKINNEIKNLVDIYNNVTNIIKNQLQSWDAKITLHEKNKLEETSAIKSLEKFD